METSRNYSNAELRKVSVRDRGRECCEISLDPMLDPTRQPEQTADPTS